MNLKIIIDKHPIAILLTVIIGTVSITSGVLVFLYENFRIPALLAKEGNSDIRAMKQEIAGLKTNALTKSSGSYNIQPAKVDSKVGTLAEIERLRKEYVDRGYARVEKEIKYPELQQRVLNSSDEDYSIKRDEQEKINGLIQEAKVFVNNILLLAEKINDNDTIIWCERRQRRLYIIYQVDAVKVISQENMPTR
jgi:hypothetical protein